MGNAAVFLLIRKTTTDKVLDALRGRRHSAGTSFDHTKAERCTKCWRIRPLAVFRPEVRHVISTLLNGGAP